MTRPRGNSTSKAQQTQRQTRVIEELSQNPAVTQQELADKTGASLATVKRDLEKVDEKLREQAGDAVADYREQQLAELRQLRQQLQGNSISAAKKVELALQIIDREIRLLGTEAPKKLLVAVGVPVRLVAELQQIVGELDETQLQRLVLKAREILNNEDLKPVERHGITWLPSPRHSLGTLEPVLLPPDPDLEATPPPRPQPAPKQLPAADTVAAPDDADTELDDRLGRMGF